MAILMLCEAPLGSLGPPHNLSGLFLNKGYPSHPNLGPGWVGSLQVSLTIT